MVSKNEFKVLDFLKGAVSPNNRFLKDYINVPSTYKTRAEIIKQTGLSKQNISNYMLKHSDWFICEPIKLNSKDPFKFIEVFGLSQKGENAWYSYWLEHIKPKATKDLVRNIKKDADSFINPSTNKFISLTQENCGKFFLTFMTSFNKDNEMFFDIKIKLKPKFKKNKKDIYKKLLINEK